MDEQYDVIVCGTGLKECILSGLLSVKGLKVLHLDRNNYYGGESASLNLTHLYEKFRPGQAPPAAFGTNRDWNVDLVPKFVMACGKLVKILLHTKVTRYLEWKSVDGSYVYQYQQAGLLSAARGTIHKVPATDVEAVKSNLMGLFEKKRCKNFFVFVQSYDAANPATHAGLDLSRVTMREVFEHFQLHENTIDFLGHSVALHDNDGYIDMPALPTIEKMQLYMYSLARYGKSPFIYPIYGLGGLPEGFSRLSAIHGGTYMLNKPVDEIVFDEAGRAVGVRSGDEVARAGMVICDPSYVLGSPAAGLVRPTGRVVRCICILNHTIPHTNDATSCQIIIPQKQVNRGSDIYISMISWAHCVASRDRYVAICSTTVETANPEAELQPAFDLLGAIEERFFSVSETFEPVNDGTANKLFISKSFDASSHFESATDDCLEMYQRITGEPLDLTIRADPEDLQEDQQ